jgi:hypothetical protein
MTRILALATTLALVLGIAASSFAENNTKVKTPIVKASMLKEKAVKKHQKHRHHRNRRWYRKHRHHG